MNEESLIPKTTPAGIFYTLGSIALVVVAMIVMEGILQPLVISFFVWFIIHQLKLTIRKVKVKGRGLPNWLANILSVAIILALLVLMVDVLARYLEKIVKQMPTYLAQLNSSFDQLEVYLRNPTITKYLQGTVESLDFTGYVSSIVGSLSGSIANLLIILVYVIFFLLEESIYNQKIMKLFPAKGEQYESFMKTLESVFESIRSYIWQKTVISIYTALVSLVLLWILKVEYAMLWAILIFLFNYIPYLGPLISSILPAVFAGLVSADIWRVIYVFAAMEGVQFFLGNFVEPRIMGKGTNLGPVTVIVALAIFGLIWGIVGMILAVPIAALIVIICSQIPPARFVAVLMSEKGEID